MLLNQAEQQDNTRQMEPRTDVPDVPPDTKWLIQKTWHFDWDIAIRNWWRKLFDKG